MQYSNILSYSLIYISIHISKLYNVDKLIREENMKRYEDIKIKLISYK